MCQGRIGKSKRERTALRRRSPGRKISSVPGFQDPLVGPNNELYPFSDDVDQVADEISRYISRIKPQIILTHGPGGEYGHPAHIQAHQAVMSALNRLGTPVESVYAPSWLSRETGKFTPEPGIVVDITPWKGKKLEAIQCHRSQHGLFIRKGSERAGRPVTIPEIVRTREALCRILPENEWLKKTISVSFSRKFLFLKEMSRIEFIELHGRKIA